MMKPAPRQRLTAAAVAVLVAPWTATLTTAAAATTTAPRDLPACPYPDGPYPTFFPDPTDPGRYYECSNGQPILMHCPPGLAWNQTALTCTFPDH